MKSGLMLMSAKGPSAAPGRDWGGASSQHPPLCIPFPQLHPCHLPRVSQCPAHLYLSLQIPRMAAPGQLGLLLSSQDVPQGQPGGDKGFHFLLFLLLGEPQPPLPARPQLLPYRACPAPWRPYRRDMPFRDAASFLMGLANVRGDPKYSFLLGGEDGVLVRPQHRSQQQCPRTVYAPPIPTASTELTCC